MALIKCPECGKEISDKSNECIYCGFPLSENATNNNIYSNSHQWRCSKCGNLISSEPCEFCKENTDKNFTATSNEIANNAAGQTPVAVNGNGQRFKGILGSVATFLVVMLILKAVSGDFSVYYVAKHPDFNAGTIKIDGYMHKSKKCCQNVADTYDAEVIRVKPKQKAGENEYGQTVTYEDAFYYCPLCN